MENHFALFRYVHCDWNFLYTIQVLLTKRDLNIEFEKVNGNEDELKGSYFLRGLFSWEYVSIFTNSQQKKRSIEMIYSFIEQLSPEYNVTDFSKTHQES